MGDEHILMQEVCETYGITAKRLASDTGRAAPTVYRYLAGEATIPVFVWRKLFELTGDARIWQLITGSARITLVQCQDHRIPLARPMLVDLIRARRHQIEFEKEILDALEDGRIDKTDRITIAKIKQDYPKAVEAMAQIYYAVVEAYESSEAKR